MSEQAEWGGRIVEWARRFHVEYEYQAKRFGWKSQTPVDFDDLPEANRQTMLNTVAAVMGSEVYPRERLVEAVTAERDALREMFVDEGMATFWAGWRDKQRLPQVTAELSELRARVERVKAVIEKATTRGEIKHFNPAKDLPGTYANYFDDLLVILEGNAE